MRKHSLLFLFCLLFAFATKAQEPLQLDSLLQWVYEHHPVSRQAALTVRGGAAMVQEARGGFDPKAKLSNSEKTFDKKTYYLLRNGSLTVPTWFGADIKAGYEQNAGLFLNPENNVPNQGLWSAGISMPVLRNLLIDQRRAALRQAQLYAQATTAERQMMLNEVLLGATEAYWKWIAYYNGMRIYEEAVDRAQFRFEGVKAGFQAGDEPAIDTLEALLQVQSRQVDYNAYQLEYQKAKLKLETFLWLEGMTPLELGDSLRPQEYNTLPPAALQRSLLADSLLYDLETFQPQLRYLQLKQEQISIKRRLAAEMLKPELNVRYNILAPNTNPIGVEQTYLNDFNNNYKWGFEFAMPLFLRKERGKLNKARVDLESIQVKRQDKTREITNKLRALQAALQTNKDQLDLYEATVANYFRLLEGERTKFENGESSLFLVNSRELKWLDARTKLIELRAKYETTVTELEALLGSLSERFE